MSCDICRGKHVTAVGARELARHMCSSHGFSLRPVRGNKWSSRMPGFFSCPFCKVQIQTRPAMRQHLQQTHSADLRKKFPTPNLAYQCHHCKSLFWRIADRNEHQLTVHNDQLRHFFKCYLCHKLFSSKVCLNRHAVGEHGGSTLYDPMAYKCKVCLTMLPDLTMLKQHFQEHHPRNVIFRCNRCNTSVKTKKMFQSHMKEVHGGPKRMDCHLCGKVLWSKEAHTLHLRTKHSALPKTEVKDQKPLDIKVERKVESQFAFHCGECGKGFVYKAGLNNHRKLHMVTGVLKCEYCGKEFKHKDSYNEHLLIHTGPRHKCPHCPKEFVQKSNLAKHLTTHT